MKKIMFNDRYGLTQAVLDGRKTQTRRIVSQSLIDKYDEWYDDVCCIARPSGSVIETLQKWRKAMLIVGIYLIMNLMRMAIQ